LNKLQTEFDVRVNPPSTTSSKNTFDRPSFSLAPCPVSKPHGTKGIDRYGSQRPSVNMNERAGTMIRHPTRGQQQIIDLRKNSLTDKAKLNKLSAENREV